MGVAIDKFAQKSRGFAMVGRGRRQQLPMTRVPDRKEEGRFKSDDREDDEADSAEAVSIAHWSRNIQPKPEAM
jgi:hypothetical protein